MYLAGRPLGARLGLAAIAGAMAGLAQPPVSAWLLLFVAFPLAIWLMDGLPAGRWKAAFGLGWAFGAGYFGVCLYWVGAAFFVDAQTYLWMMPFAVLALAGGMALYWGLAFAVASQAWAPGLWRIVALAAALGLAEWLRGHLMTGFPWTALGLAALDMGALGQLAALFGMTGLSFLLPLWAGLPALLAGPGLQGRSAALPCVLIALLPLAWLWGNSRIVAVAEVPGVQLRIVQPNIPQNDKWRVENARAIFEKLIASTSAPGEGSALASHIIWPESAVPFYIEEEVAALARLEEVLREPQILITGALRREVGPDGRKKIYNSILGFDALGNLVLRYDKWRLVPGGEFLPLAQLLEPLGFRKVVTVPGNFEAGTGPATLPVPGAPLAGFLICYEAIFPDALIDDAHRPEWLVNVTNDGWFGRSSGPYQHLAQLRMRAIEHGLPAARAANSGISAVIDPFGRITASLGLGEAGALDSGLPQALPPTLYGRTGDVWLLLPGGLLLLGLARSRFARAWGAGDEFHHR